MTGLEVRTVKFPHGNDLLDALWARLSVGGVRYPAYNAHAINCRDLPGYNI